MATISVSTKPWSAYTEADYSITQWHNACLIHQHTGPPTSKAQCKLPVKTPDGVVNKNGVFAAAAALAGARSPIKATAQQKAEAGRKLVTLYRQIGAQPPPSLTGTKHSMDHQVDDFLEHFGVLGMKWGIRRIRRNEAVGRAARGEGGLATKARQIGNLGRQSLFIPIGTTITLVDLVKGHGLKGAAQRKFNRVAAREGRIRAHNGQAHISDYLVHFGSTRVTDFLPMRSGKAATPSTPREDKRIIAAHGALFVAKVLGKAAAKSG